MTFTPIVEYNLLWEALIHYKSRLEKLSSMTMDEDQEIMYDEKLQDFEGLLNSIKISAKEDFGLNLK